MRILVMGAGAVGSVAGGLMAKAGHGVTLVGRKAHLDAIAARGLSITGIWGDHRVEISDLATDVSGLSRGAFDLILISVKSYATAGAVEAIAPLADAETLVCSYQNGLGNAEILAEAVGWERVVGARVIFGARTPEPGATEVTVFADSAALGIYETGPPVDRVREVASAMDDAGLPTVFTDRIATVLWSKVAYNCALNPLSALLDTPYGGVAATEQTRAIMAEVIHELYEVGKAMGILLEPATSEEYLKLLLEVLVPATASHYASMREDVRRKSRTEIDALNGAIARYGAEHGIACPINTTLTRLIQAREEAYLAG